MEEKETFIMNNRETIQELADLFIGGGFECETPEEEQMLIWVKEQMNILNEKMAG